MIRRTFLLIAVLGTTLLSAQKVEKRPLTLTDAIGRAWQYYPERLTGLQWIPGADSYSFAKGDSLMAGSTRGSDQVLITLEGLNEALAGQDTLLRLPGVEWADGKTFFFSKGNRTYAYDLARKKAALRFTLPDEAENDDHNKTYTRIAFTKDNNLYIAGPGNKIAQVTEDGTDGIVNGQSVHRDEYGISKGTFWSPDGELLAFYRMDETMVTPYYVEDISTTPSTFKKFRYPMAGQTSHHVTLGVYDTRSGETVFIDPEGPKDHYLTNISWSADSKYVHIILLDRTTDHFRVIRYDAATGKAVRTLFEEHDDKWLEPENPLTFLKKTPGQYIHWSQRDGWWHLYLYDVERGMIRQLTSGNRVIKRLIGLDAGERFVYVEGTGEIDSRNPAGAMDTHVYRVELATGQMKQVTKEAGTHRAQLNGNGLYLIDQWASLGVPGRTEILEASSGKVMKTLLASPDPLKDIVRGTIEFVQVTGEQGTILNGRIIKPSDFDPKKKYPVLVYTYNGPHVQLVTNSFLGGAPLWMLEAAERGYIVFTLDGHGSSNRGLAFEQVIHRQLGITEVKDQLHGADYLKGLPYVDGDRMAVHGWSYGGHMTTALMLRSPDTFKVGVAGGAVQDWRLYEIMYTERYMDTPEENPEGYAATTLPDMAENLKGDLLLIHDNMDQTVVPQHVERFLKSCVDKGIYPDFFYYPGHEHNVRGRDRIHLYTQILDYIDQKLGVADR